MTNVEAGCVLWFTGLSGSGKSTIANHLFEVLQKKKIRCERLDGDLLRENLCKDLGYSKEDRDKNIERAAFVANILSRHGVIVLATFITPYESQRQFLKKNIEKYMEIYVNTPLEICEKRDVKGLYKRARQGEIPFFTGISDVFEPSQNPDIELHADKHSLETCVSKIIEVLSLRNFLPGT